MSKSVLLVDDSATVLMFEQMMLRGTGLHLRVARNGQQALSEIRKDPPDLILLDIIMPDVTGIEICKRLKEDPNTRKIPILMVTTKAESETVERAFKAGCNDFVTKPIDKAELIAKVMSFLGA